MPIPRSVRAVRAILHRLPRVVQTTTITHSLPRYVQYVEIGQRENITGPRVVMVVRVSFGAV